MSKNWAGREVLEAELDALADATFGTGDALADDRARIFGRALPVREAAVADNVKDFRRIGLSEAVASKAAHSLDKGIYSSFEEAAVASSAFSPDGSKADYRKLEVVLEERANGGTTSVSEADLDAVDDDAFGKTVKPGGETELRESNDKRRAGMFGRQIKEA